jgi:hypothetical protein
MHGTSAGAFDRAVAIDPGVDLPILLGAGEKRSAGVPSSIIVPGSPLARPMPSEKQVQ